MRRAVVLAVSLAAALGVVTADVAAQQRACRPTTSAKCLKQARGVEAIDVRASGRIDRATALQAFVQTVAPLPGVAVRRGAVGTLQSGSGPIRWLAPYRSTLTPAQRKVYDAIATGRRAGFAPRRRARARASVTPSAKLRAEWQQLLEDAVPRVGGHLGVELDAKVESELQPHPAAGDASADAKLTKDVCHVNVYPEGWAGGLDLTSRRFLAAHEITHCFQERIAGKEYDDEAARSWLIEGSAQWAGGVIALEWSAASTITWGGWRGWYDRYLTTAQARLFERTYSAVGFFGHLERSGVAVWPRLRFAFTASTAEGAYRTMVTGSDVAFLDTWAPGFAREPSWGSAWDTSGPSIPGTRGGQPHHGLPNGETVKITARPRSAPLHRVDVTADVVELARSGDPHGRLRDRGGTEWTLDPNAFCAKAGGCACPDGTEGASLGGLPELASGVARVGVASYEAEAAVTLRGRSLSDFCKKPGATPRPVSDLRASGAVEAVGRVAGSCAINFGDQFIAIFQLDGPFVADIPGQPPYPKPYYLQLNARWQGPGEYVTQQRGVTSGPTVHFTDGHGNAWETEMMPGDEPTGRFTVDAGGQSGTVEVTMFNNDASTFETASGRWRCGS